MSERLKVADHLENNHEKYVQLIHRYPLEIQSSDSVPDSDPDFFRVVIDTPAQLDLLITQLRFGATPGDALNRTLIR